jgi:hypothetical protein
MYNEFEPFGSLLKALLAAFVQLNSLHLCCYETNTQVFDSSASNIFLCLISQNSARNVC